MVLKANEANSSKDDLLTEGQARDQELPMSLAWYRRSRVRGGGPPFIRISNRIFYRRGALRQWITERTAPASAAKHRYDQAIRGVEPCRH